MSLYNTLIKIQAMVGVTLLACLTPLLIVFALLAKMLSKVLRCFCESPKSIIGEVAVVTGAAHGLGRAIALELARKGCKIAAVDIDLTGAENTVKQIIETVPAKAYKVDVVNYEEIVKLNEQITKDLGSVTILINNAGLLMHRNPVNPTPNEVQQMINVNLTSHFWTKNVFLPKMKELRKGFVVSIASLAGWIPLPYSTSYTATKAGVYGHMKALRLELAIEKQSNIRVSTVLPTFLQANEEVVSVTEQLNMDRLYPLVSSQAAARRIVEGMLRGEREIVIPDIGALLYRSVSVLPIAWQDYLLLLVSASRFQDFCKLYSK
ncbi:uncharacterized protein Dwil_GK11608 [Drosophila willistoni]|uniref:Short-chain dehydrogenase/reductase 3 n=1 Tax=Drosophila willistoni TaxID=7260 RepID=B4N9F4_DROWI|nr:17-beta-hydroxysteroid dehydrogenase 13 [Drosophila willistoni]EDW80587.1 uncharacterized protein Dwil_GK11608 [Drosophila willistoni]